MTVHDLIQILQDFPCDMELFLDSTTALVAPLEYIELDEDTNGNPFLVVGTTIESECSVTDFDIVIN